MDGRLGALARSLVVAVNSIVFAGSRKFSHLEVHVALRWNRNGTATRFHAQLTAFLTIGHSGVRVLCPAGRTIKQYTRELAVSFKLRNGVAKSVVK